MSTEVTSYQSWQTYYKPKLKANLSPGEEAQDSYRTNAIGIQVNGSTVTLGLLNHLDKLITIPVFRDDNKAQPATDEEREQALESVFKMVADVVKAQKNSDTKVPVSIDISASGFSINKHPEFFSSKGLTAVRYPNVHYLENYTVSQQPSGLRFPEGDYKKTSFISFRQRLENVLLATLGDMQGINIAYLDESGPTRVTQGQESFSLNMTTMNDTNTPAFQLGDQLNQGDTVIGLVGGTGFNVGVNKNFNKVTGNFEHISNLECGAGLLNEETLSPFLSPIDIFNLKENPQLKPETFFASGKAGEELGLVRIAEFLRESPIHSDVSSDELNIRKAIALDYLKQIGLNGKLPPWLKGSEPLTNEFIMNKAKDNEPLALAMVNDFASRWGGFIKNRLDTKGLLNGVNNPKYAYTGSHLRHLLEITSAREAFAKALGVSPNSLFEIKKGEMDGMQAILKAKIAIAKAAV